MKPDFETNTNWIVITGAPSSGKTTVLDELAKKGYHTEPETARLFIESEMAKGRPLEDIKADALHLQIGILKTKIDRETRLNPEELVLFDRGIPDTIAYCELCHLSTKIVLQDCYHFKYKYVFHFDRLPLIKDGTRIDTEEDADFLDNHLEKAYQSLGYTVIRVPVMSIKDRVDFILGYLPA